MARMLSQVATIIRGSVGGVTYTANQFQAIIQRARVAPVQPNTNYQNWMRSGCAVAESAWKNLTEAQKADWQDFADTVNFVGPLGNYTVRGRNLFFGWAGLRRYLVSRGVSFSTPVNTAPVLPGRLVPPSDFNVAAPPTGVGFSVDVYNHNSVVVHMCTVRSRAFNNTRNTYKGPWQSDTLQIDASIGASSGGSFVFTNLTVGAVYFVRLYFITNGDTVNVSNDVILRLTAVAAA